MSFCVVSLWIPLSTFIVFIFFYSSFSYEVFIDDHFWDFISTYFLFIYLITFYYNQIFSHTFFLKEFQEFILAFMTYYYCIEKRVLEKSAIWSLSGETSQENRSEFWLVKIFAKNLSVYNA